MSAFKYDPDYDVVDDVDRATAVALDFPSRRARIRYEQELDDPVRQIKQSMHEASAHHSQTVEPERKGRSRTTRAAVPTAYARNGQVAAVDSQSDASEDEKEDAWEDDNFSDEDELLYEIDAEAAEAGGGKGGRLTTTTVGKAVQAARQVAKHTSSANGAAVPVVRNAPAKRAAVSGPKALGREVASVNKRLYVGDLKSRLSLTNSVETQVKESERQLAKSAVRVKDKADRATAEQVLDPRTRMILVKMLNTGVVGEVHGCVSTGKEANVYFATTSTAVKPSTATGSAAAAVLGAGSTPVSSHPVDGAAPPSSTTAAPAPAGAADPSSSAAGLNSVTVSNAPSDAVPSDSTTAPSSSTGVAIKIYKTSILVFKDRDRYVSGEHRFKTGYCKSNPRKMVKLWAEKEMRNLKRLEAAGIPCPKPLFLRSHVLAMTFLGADGWPAPRLKDAQMSQNRWRACYTQVVWAMRQMYRTCRLVHADLSEYNMLYYDKRVYIIDVSQSVEHEHPHAMDFLRKDITNVNLFFGQHGVTCLTNRALFEFIIADGPDVPLDEVDRMISEREAMAEEEAAAAVNDPERAAARALKETADEQVFMQSYIPRSLQEIDLDKDVRADEPIPNSKNRSAMAFAVREMAGANLDVSGGLRDQLAPLGDDDVDDDDDDDDESDQDQDSAGDHNQNGDGVAADDGSEKEWTERPAVDKDTIRQQRKQEKKQAKAETREKRSHKMKKKDKQKKIKQTSGKR